MLKLFGGILFFNFHNNPTESRFLIALIGQRSKLRLREVSDSPSITEQVADGPKIHASESDASTAL